MFYILFSDYFWNTNKYDNHTNTAFLGEDYGIMHNIQNDFPETLCIHNHLRVEGTFYVSFPYFYLMAYIFQDLSQ